MQGHADRSGGLSEYPGNRRRIQAGQHPEGNGFGLIVRQRTEQLNRLPRRKRVEYLVLYQVVIGYGGYRLWHRNCRPALAGADIVYGPVPADRKQPAPEVFFPAGETGQVANYLQPRLAGDVFSIFTIQNPQVTQQAGLELPPQLQEPRLVT
ncbi:MAG TPA: hypothetical protein VMA95_00630 [Streptosporangiaceae bacterium]|nr:hypothetical protein [Streptosporangiaceae bacterium]